MIDIIRCIEDRNGLHVSGTKDELAELMFSESESTPIPVDKSISVSHDAGNGR